MTRLKIKTGLIVVLCMMVCITTAYADEGGLSVSRSDEGDIVAYTISLMPESRIQAANYTLSFKEGALEFLDQQDGPAASADGAMFITNLNTDSKWLKLGYISTNPNQEGGTLVTVRFKKIGEELDKPVVGLSVDEIKDGDGNDLPQNILGDNSVGKLPSGVTINDTNTTPQSLPALSEQTGGDGKTEEVSGNTDVQSNTSTEKAGVGLGNQGEKTELPIKNIIALCSILVVLAAVLIITVVVKGKRNGK